MERGDGGVAEEQARAVDRVGARQATVENPNPQTKVEGSGEGGSKEKGDSNNVEGSGEHEEARVLEIGGAIAGSHSVELLPVVGIRIGGMIGGGSTIAGPVGARGLWVTNTMGMSRVGEWATPTLGLEWDR